MVNPLSTFARLIKFCSIVEGLILVVDCSCMKVGHVILFGMFQFIESWCFRVWGNYCGRHWSGACTMNTYMHAKT